MTWGRRQGVPCKVVLVMCVAMGLASSRAAADWSEFVPHPFENGAYLDLYSSYEHDHTRNGSVTSHWTDDFIREKLTLFSNGYSYHPRFLLYQFSVAGAVKQEDYSSSGIGDVGWQDSTGLEYDAKVFLLPEHAYNLRLFASRYEPLFKEQAATQHSSVENSRGAVFRYRKKPYFAHLAYTDDSIDSGGATSDVQRVSADAEYLKRYTGGNELDFRGAINPSWFSNSQGIDGNAQEYLVSNFVTLQPARLDSTLTYNTFDQQSGNTGKFTNDQFASYELFTAQLPLNFRIDADNRFQDNHSTNDTDLSSQTINDKSDDVRFDLVHRLYESLDSAYTFNYDWQSSGSGEITSLTDALNLNYTKLIPVGRFLAGTSLSRTDTNNNGQATIPNQPYPGIAVPGSFTLRQQNVASVTGISVQCSAAHPCPPPLVPNQVVQLTEGIDYSLTKLDQGNTYEININALPSPLVVPGTYDLLVTYTLVGGTFDLQTDVYGATTSVELFDRLLTPYFNYLAVRSDVLSGTFPGQPVDSTAYTTGLIVTRGPLRVRGEYQDLESDINPSRTWRADGQYVSSLNASTSIYATASYLNKYYPQGTSTSSPEAFTQETETVSANIQKQFFMRSMSLAAGGAYSHLQGQINGDTYSGNAAWNWKIGRMDVTAGATLYGSDTSGSGTISTQRDHQFVFLKVRRQLF